MPKVSNSARVESAVTCNQWSLISYSISNNIQLCPHDSASNGLNYTWLYAIFPCNATQICVASFLINEHSAATVPLRVCGKEAIHITSQMSVTMTWGFLKLYSISSFHYGESILKYATFEVFTAVTMKNAVFWDIKTQFVLQRGHITSPLQSKAS
jgi:hypothetical protein